MRTLILDTSGPFTTVLITEEDQILTSNVLRDRPAEHLHEQIHSSFEKLGMTPHDLSRIAVVIGPGSWTGLNIGVTTAKTLAQILKIPLVPIYSLDALSESAAKPSWILMNAGRNQCYYARFSNSGSETMAVGPIDDIIQQIRGDSNSILILEYGDTYKEQFTDNDRYLSIDRLRPETLLAAIKPSNRLQNSDILSLTPAYLQPSHVEQDASQ